MEFPTVIKILAICSLICFGLDATGGSEVTPEVEQPAVSVQFKKLGDREYLPPNLIGLQSLACAYLPETLRLINVLEAFREIINAIRYDLVIRAIDNNDSEVICHIVVKEKPWLRSNLGEKFRLLDYTNCSRYYENDNFLKSEGYEPFDLNANRGSDVVSYNLSTLESQIMPKKTEKSQRKSYFEDYEQTTQQTTENSQETSKTHDLSGDAKEFLESFFNVNSQEEIHARKDSKNKENNENSNRINNYESESREPIYEPQSSIYRQKRDINSKENKRDALLQTQFRSKGRQLNKAEHLFLKYQRKYNKNYDHEEQQKRFHIFKRNLIKIERLNHMEQGTAKYGITEFADMTEAEYKQRTGLLPRGASNNIKNILADIPDFKLPREFDWRKRGAVSKVKDQGNCGSCWAFSVTGNIEGLHAIKNGNLEEYSEQELLDCDTIDSACNGGLPDDAYKAIEQLGGLELESEYPYKAKKGNCHLNSSLIHVKVTGAVDLPKNETAMALWLVANGPISIGINANAMQFYRGGISHPWKVLCRPKGIDHGVLIVGFGIQEYPLFNKTLPYWIVKNSWGNRWGEQGYYRVYRGDNTCGINSMASSAILA